MSVHSPTPHALEINPQRQTTGKSNLPGEAWVSKGLAAHTGLESQVVLTLLSPLMNMQEQDPRWGPKW